LEARIAGDDKQLRETRQLGDDISHDTVGEILLLGVRIQIGKGQNGNRRFVGERKSRLALKRWGRLRFRLDPVHADQFRDVL
jgi:hypothetical protein